LYTFVVVYVQLFTERFVEKTVNADRGSAVWQYRVLQYCTFTRTNTSIGFRYVSLWTQRWTRTFHRSTTNGDLRIRVINCRTRAPYDAASESSGCLHFTYAIFTSRQLSVYVVHNRYSDFFYLLVTHLEKSSLRKYNQWNETSVMSYDVHLPFIHRFNTVGSARQINMDASSEKPSEVVRVTPRFLWSA
jgi:hypothetical protein